MVLGMEEKGYQEQDCILRSNIRRDATVAIQTLLPRGSMHSPDEFKRQIFVMSRNSKMRNT
jgi:hypothetical protein